MKRRDFITLLGGVAVAWPLAASAQAPKNIPRLCFLTFDPGTLQSNRFDAFFKGLRDLGYASGQNIAIDYLSVEGNGERFPALAAECLRLKADVIAVSTTPAAQAAMAATRTIPIIMVGLGDPVRTGLVNSLGQPGGNVTGLSLMVPEVAAKASWFVEGGHSWNLACSRPNLPRRPDRAVAGEGIGGGGGLARRDAAGQRHPHCR
jgi:putative ABC transport system substrate-binding protein